MTKKRNKRNEMWKNNCNWWPLNSVNLYQFLDFLEPLKESVNRLQDNECRFLFKLFGLGGFSQ